MSDYDEWELSKPPQPAQAFAAWTAIQNGDFDPWLLQLLYAIRGRLAILQRAPIKGQEETDKRDKGYQ